MMTSHHSHQGHVSRQAATMTPTGGVYFVNDGAGYRTGEAHRASRSLCFSLSCVHFRLHSEKNTDFAHFGSLGKLETDNGME